MNLPRKINVSGVIWDISICDKPSDVDGQGRESFLGQADFWTKKIRIYRRNHNQDAMWQSFWHEMFHIFFEQINEQKLCNNEKLISQLAGLLNDTLTRNKLLR